MINFKPIGIEDKELITSYFLACGNRDCNLSFVNLFTWQFLTNSCYAVVDDCLIVRFTLDEESVVYTMPVGRGDVKGIVGLLKEQAREEGHVLRFMACSRRWRNGSTGNFPGVLTIVWSDYFDYIYSRKDLAGIEGKNFQPSGHVNKFKRTYNYRYTPLTADMIPHCLELEEKWCEQHGCDEEQSLINERKALNLALRHFDELELTGGALWVDDEIVGFTYGAPVNRDTFAVHIEKADSHIDGAYNILNQEFALHIPEQYIYLNREEDLGLVGLRKAKLSYRPVILLEKGYAQLIEN